MSLSHFRNAREGLAPGILGTAALMGYHVVGLILFGIALVLLETALEEV